LYIVDNGNRRIRKVTYPPILTTPTIFLAGTTSVPVGATVTVNATVASAGSSYVIHWLNHGMEFTTTTVPVVTYMKPPGTDTITARVVPTGYGCWDSTTSTGHIVTSNTTGTSNMSSGRFVFVYPNPAHNELTIINQSVPCSIAITNMYGQVAIHKNLAATKETISVQTLQPGIYFVQLTNAVGDKTITRILKE
jgi:hypothetical protein